MKSLFRLLVVIVIFSGLMYSQSDILTIIYMNDTHSLLSPTGPRNPDLTGTMGGIARAASVIGMNQAAETNVLTLHSGDVFMGDVYFNKFFGVPEFMIYKNLNLDAMAVGNHEFDLGPDNLFNVLSTAFSGGSFPLLSANIINPGALGTYIFPYTTKTFGDIKVGIFGLTTHAANEQSMPYPVVISDDFLTIAGQMVTTLRTAEQCDFVICLSHYGIEGDRAIATYVPGIDLIVGGHDHILVDAEKIGDTYIVQTLGQLRSIGKIKFQYSGNSFTLLSNEIIPLDSSIPEVPEIKAIVDELSGQIETYYNIPFYSTQVAFAAGFFDEIVNKFDKNGNHSSALGNFICDAFKWKTGTQIAFEAGGSIAMPIFEGPLVPADLFRAVGYGFNTTNTLGFQLVTFNITGINLWTAIETVLSADMEEFFPQFSGLKCQYDPSADPGSKVQSIKIDGKKLNPQAVYSVTSNEFTLMMLTALGIEVTDAETLTGVTEFLTLMDYTLNLGGILQPDHEARIIGIKGGGNKNLVKGEAGILPEEMVLDQNYPNPFNPSTSISFNIPQDARIKLVIFNLLGEEIEVLADEFRIAGRYTVSWNPGNLPGGIYFCRLQSENLVQTRKMILLK
jgi:5'-nucleotidase / UDP-sugar diphosphatase